MINKRPFIYEKPVSEILKISPNMLRVFISYKLACPGCGFAQFCSLEDAVKIYKIEEEPFMEQVERHFTQQPKRSES